MRRCIFLWLATRFMTGMTMAMACPWRRTALTHYRVLALWCVLASGAAGSADDFHASEKQRFTVTTVVHGLEHPWSMAFLPDGRMLVTERPGRLRLINPDGRLDPAPVRGLPDIAVTGQGGLLDIALHPDYARTGWIYLSYVGKGQGGYGTEVLRGKLDGGALKAVEVLFRMQPKTNPGQHFGSRLAFDREGLLYITLGDRAEKERAQKLDDHAGSVIRLHDDGSVPRDNPFVGVPGAKTEKFTYGHRSVQGLALNPGSGELWAHEHGPQGGDELNILRRGQNYGWPVITYGRNYVFGTRIGEGTAKPGMVQPVLHWTPSIGPSGMAFYRADRFPSWKDNLFVGALRDEMLVRLELEGDRVLRQEQLLKGKYGRIRDVRIGPDGLIYLLTDAADGRMLRLQPAP